MLVRAVEVYSEMFYWCFVREVVPRAVREQQDRDYFWGKCLKHWPEPPFLAVVLLWVCSSLHLKVG